MKRSTLTAVLAIIIILLVGGIGFVAYRRGGILPASNTVLKDSGDNISDYTAVFLTNGQVYFGKMYSSPGDQLDVRDIYYLQVNQQIQPDQKKTDTDAQPNVVLVKLGDELHGPNDRMLINKSQVIFTESLKKGSKVVDAIANYQTKK